MSVWAAVMLQVFKRHTARIRQLWGVTSDEEPIVQLNPDWDHELTRSNCGALVNLGALLYVFAYVAAIFGVLAWQFQLDDTSPLYSYSSLILVAVIPHLQKGTFPFFFVECIIMHLSFSRNKNTFMKLMDLKDK